jgi:hypothetical protein
MNDGKQTLLAVVGEEMHLVNVERMELSGRVYDTPMLICPDADSRQRSCFGSVLLPVDIEAVLILGKRHHNSRAFSVPQ